VVRDGASGTADGPLANLYVAPDGTWHTIAAGRAYHAGDGGPWRDVPADRGNDYLIGIEVSDMGASGTVIGGAQYAALCTGIAALLEHSGFDSGRYLHHRTWAPDRKVDLRNALDTMRLDIDAAQNGETMRYVSLSYSTALEVPVGEWTKLPLDTEANDEIGGHTGDNPGVELPKDPAQVVHAGVCLKVEGGPVEVRVVRGPSGGSYTSMGGGRLDPSGLVQSVIVPPFGSRDNTRVELRGVGPGAARVTEAAFRLTVARRG
jgi:hypothetical protein